MIRDRDRYRSVPDLPLQDVVTSLLTDQGEAVGPEDGFAFLP